MEDMESLLIPQISMDVDDTPLNLEDNQGDEEDAAGATECDNEENIQMRLRNLMELENFDPAQTPEKLSDSEVEAKERLFSEGHPPIEYVRMHCSSCNCHLGTAPLNQDNRYIHPLLNVLVCKNCYEFYCSGDFEKDEDGSELYCRWCGQGGKVMCCSGCAYVFCQRCVRQNLGKRTLDLIIESDDWFCFACNPSQLINLRILCATLFDYVKQEIREVKQSGEIDRLKRDFSMCCTNKSMQQKYSMPVRKRRRVPSDDATYHPSRDRDLMESRRFNTTPKKGMMMGGSAGTSGVMSITKPLPPLQKGGLVVQSPPPLVGIGTVATNQIRFNQSTSNPRMPSITAIRGFPTIQPRPTLLQNHNSIRPQLSAKPVQLLCATNARPITSNTVSNMAVSLNNQLTSNVNRGSQNFIPLTNNGQPNNGQPNNGQPNNIQTTGGVVRGINNNNSNQGNRRVSSLPTHFPPGLRNNWFNQAATITSTIVARLSTSLVDLSNEQANATSVEQLATVHNKLQELLSSSVNSMIQVRKNLRNEFLNDLNKMKFTAVPKQQNNNSTATARRLTTVAAPRPPTINRLTNSQPITVDDDDDVIIVNNEEEDPLAITTVMPDDGEATAAPSDTIVDLVVSSDGTETEVESTASCKIIAGPGIKIKVKTDLFKPCPDKNDSDKSTDSIANDKPLEIKDDDVKKVQEDSKPDKTLLLTEESMETDQDKIAEPPVEAPQENKDFKADDLAHVDKETYLQIQHALAESKLEALIEENSKYKVDTAEICPEELAKILTVRVVLTTNYSPLNFANKRRRLSIKQEAESPEKVTAASVVDFEDILHGNLINTEQAKSHFDQAFSSFVEQNKTVNADEEEEEEEELEEEVFHNREEEKNTGDVVDDEEENNDGSEKEVEEIVVDPLDANDDGEEENEEEIAEELIEENGETESSNKMVKTLESSVLISNDDKIISEQIEVR